MAGYGEYPGPLGRDQPYPLKVRKGSLFSKYLDKALAYIAGHDQVGLTRGADIIDWYKRSAVG